ncbi:MAG: cell division protein FtsW [Clostridia bacterium]|nr:cell division protein FtsW [Clostridia bacterium]
MANESYTNGNRHVRRRPEQVTRSSARTDTVQNRSSGRQNGQHPDTSRRTQPAASEYRFTSGRPANTNPRNTNGGQYRNNPNTAKYTSGRVQPVRKPEQMQSRKPMKGRNAPPRQTAALDPVRSLTPRQEKRLMRAEQKEREWQANIVRVRGGVDKIMLGLILLLVCLGTLMVFSASYPSALAENKHMLYYGIRHAIFAAAGLVAMFVISLFPYRIFRGKVAKGLYGVTLVLLVMVLLFGMSEGEAKRWLDLKIITIQPSEIMKFSLIIIMAWYVETYKKQIDEALEWRSIFRYHVLYPGILIGLACGLVILEKHLSGTIIIFVIGWLVMLVGGCKFRWTFPIYAGAGGLAGGLFLLLNPYALKRITTHVDENANILDEAYQTAQGLYAIGSGGLFGVGLGESRQKYSYVSAAHTDFIFSIWCEELGFIGGVFLVLLYIAFIWRGYVIATRAPDTFSSLVAFGITTHVGLQAVLNMCVVTKIMFNTGISLPFFSYGGSSLMMLLGEMGVLLSISRQYYMKEKDLIAKQTRQELGME